MAKILFMSCQSRPDLRTALVFLTMRFNNPDGDDYKKLAGTIRYIRVIQGMVITLYAESMDTIRWWIGTTYGVHLDLKGHSGGIMLLRNGNVDSKSIMHRINFRSSTELEIIGVDDHMPSVLWTLRFLGGQSFKANKNIV